MFEGRNEVEALEPKIATRAECFVVFIEGDGTVCDVGPLVDREQLRFREVLEYVPHAEDDDGVADDENALAALLAGDHLGRVAQAENDVAPALPSRRAVVELSEDAAELGLIGVDVLDSDGGEAVENAELFLAEALVDDERVGVVADSSRLYDETRCVPRTKIGRSENDVGSFFRGKRSKPVAERDRLLLSEVGERNVDVADRHVDHGMAGFERRIARDVARGFSVADEVDEVRPDLGLFHAKNKVKECTMFGSEVAGCGANLVFGSGMISTPEQHDPDWPRYPETILTFATTPAVEIDLRGIPSDRAIADLAAAGFGRPFAILTAFDPHGRDISREENEKRKQGLDHRLTVGGYRFVHVDACSPDRAHCECSVAIMMPQDKAIDLSRELEQVAIFWFDGSRFWILGAIVESDPLLLPRSS